MPDFFSPDIASKVVVAVVTAIIPLMVAGYVRITRLLTDAEAMKTMMIESQAANATAQTERKIFEMNIGLHDKRLALLEQSIVVVGSIGPAIKDLAVVSARLESLQEQTNRRLEMLENKQ